MTKRSPHGTVPNSRVDSVRDWIEQALDARRIPLQDLAAAVARLASDKPTLEATALEQLGDPAARRIIDDSPLTIGAGFIAAPRIVNDADRYMLWLQKRNGSVRRLRLNFDITDVDAYDYVTMDWYTRTQTTSAPTLTGPYLDYSGSDALVLTLCVPVTAGDTFLGIAAADLHAQPAEDMMATQLCTLDHDAFLVNRERVIIASSSGRWLPGESLASESSDDFQVIAPILDWTGWVMVAPAQDATR